MEPYNVIKHISCFCYDGKEKPQVEVVKFESMETTERSLSNNKIVFVLKGSLIFFLRDNPSGELHKGEFTFIPAGDQMQCKATARSTLLILHLLDNIYMCHGISIEQLYYRMNEMEKPDKLAALQTDIRLSHFAQGMVDSWEDGLRCKIFFQAGITKLLAMLPVYYSKEELCRFFYPILSPNTAFSEYVRKNWLRYHTVNELARKLNMSPQQFSRQFYNVFKQNPLEWIRKEKARLIYEEIRKSDKPLKEIASDYHFTNQANFNRFCKDFYEVTPGEIRKRR